MEFVWICSAALVLWAKIFWFLVVHCGCLVLAITLATNCSKLCARKPKKTDPKSKKGGRTGRTGSKTTGTTATTGTTTTTTTTGGNTTHDPENAAAGGAKAVSDGAAAYPLAKKMSTTFSVTGETKTTESIAQEIANAKNSKKKKKTEDADEGKNTKGTVEEKETDYKHENTLRIEMVDDDHTKTTDASACFDAYDPNNPTGEGEGGKLEKKPSQAKNKQQSGKKKGKGKKNKNTVSVQSVECQPPPDKEKVSNSKKSKRSLRETKQPTSGPENQPQSNPEKKEKVATMIEDEATPKEKEKGERQEKRTQEDSIDK
ncbi:hypothetical protein CRE_16457 [Caenorhabditis remanei]|uniref:Uncharacterized protein n=1 Tax=Caenorhabditis remanei TaxID=31234 RepID=E3NHD3_CAERE|nr:hypothetical protein CRE_16457 [Caenorhabditis remanei]